MNVNKNNKVKVYALFERSRHDGDILEGLYWERDYPDSIAKENPIAAMDGCYVEEWLIQ